MHSISIELVGFAAGTIGFLISFLYFRRSSKLEAGIYEIAEQNEFLKTECAKLHSNFEKARTLNSQLEQSKTKLIAQDAQSHKRINDLEVILENKSSEFNKVLQKNKTLEKETSAKIEATTKQIEELKKENLNLKQEVKLVKAQESTKFEKIVGSLKSDLQSALDQNTQLATQLEKLSSEAKKGQEGSSQLENQLSIETTKRTQLEEQYAQLLSKFEESNEIKVDEDHITQMTEKYRKRAQRANYFLNTMRGQKEMAEEKVRNWEVALSLLSTWILEKKGINNVPKNIGPLVGEALSIINKESALGELALDHGAEDELSSILSQA